MITTEETVSDSGFWTSLPTENDIYHVYSLCFAKSRLRTAHENFAIRDSHDGPMPLDYNLWIVRNVHRTVIVDTGFSARASEARGRPLDIDPLTALENIGVDPGSIDDVVLTHLHYDHAGNVHRFDNARFHVQDAEVAFATGRCMCERLIRWPFDVEDIAALLRRTYAEQVRFHDGDAILHPGIGLHLLPGHSPGMQAVKVLTPRGEILLASDASHYYSNLMRRSPFLITIDSVATLQSYRRMFELVGDLEHIIPGHDPKVREYYPAREINGVELTALHEIPREHDFEAIMNPGVAAK
jgi:glyoxylase-like metal-dependent hydrolase (beta-lactamase superfamily II)